MGNGIYERKGETKTIFRRDWAARKASSPRRQRDTQESKTLNRKGRKGKIRVTGSSICYEAKLETGTGAEYESETGNLKCET
jgi:hypothetical protein